MSHALRIPSLSGLVALALLQPAAGWGETSMASHGRSASAQVNIRVWVPPVANILQNTHAASLPRQPHQGPISSTQRIVLHTNVRQGACVQLSAVALDPASWRLRSLGDEPLAIERRAGGWRLCTLRHGTHTLFIEHEFGAEAAGRWPLQTGVTLL